MNTCVVFWTFHLYYRYFFRYWQDNFDHELWRYLKNVDLNPFMLCVDFMWFSFSRGRQCLRLWPEIQTQGSMMSSVTPLTVNNFYFNLQIWKFLCQQFVFFSIVDHELDCFLFLLQKPTWTIHSKLTLILALSSSRPTLIERPYWILMRLWNSP